jgi:hypothetical protein
VINLARANIRDGKATSLPSVSATSKIVAGAGVFVHLFSWSASNPQYLVK